MMNVKYKFYSMLLSIALILGTCFTAVGMLSIGSNVFGASVVCAEEHDPRLVDDAWLLDEDEAEEVRDVLDEVSERLEADIVVVTTTDFDAEDIESYAEDYFDYHNYGYGDDKDGALLCINMDTHKWHVATSGFGIEAITDYGVEYIGDRIVDDLSEELYADAFKEFAYACEDLFTTAKNGDVYDVEERDASYDDSEDYETVTPEEHKKNNVVIATLVSLVLALGSAFGMCRMEKAQLISVAKETDADGYVVPNSFKLTKKQDLFLFTHTTRVKKDDDGPRKGGSSVHTGSSGRAHGGGGGSF